MYSDDFLIRYKPFDTPDLIWTNVTAKQSKSGSGPKSWHHLLMYLGFFLGIPYLTWKLSQAESTDDGSNSNSNWKNGKSEHYVARAEFDFQTDRSGEISFKTGDTLRIAPKGANAVFKSTYFV